MMAHPDPVRVGFVGCGAVTQHYHFPALRTLADVAVVAVADLDADRAEAAARLLRVSHRYTDVQGLLGDPAVEAVAVCVPPQWHAEIGLAALDAGKHLFVEKPVTLRLDECDRLIACAAEARRQAMVGFNFRWHRLVRRARAMIRGGALGEPAAIRSVLTAGSHLGAADPGWRRHRSAGGGAFHDMGVHHFDLWRYLTGLDVEEVIAVSRSPAADDGIASVAAAMRGGALASALFSAQTSEANEVEIFGPRGSVRLDCYRYDGLQFLPAGTGPGSVGMRLRRSAASLRELPSVVAHMRTGGELLHMYREEWRHFAAVIRDGAPLECTLDDGRRVLAVSLAAAESAARSRPVRVTEPGGLPEVHG
jgi:myo-inositol 2-dehydrogenase/D-chiro-inositol 1-dehydrogenase